MELNQFSNVDLVINKANQNFIERQTVVTGDKDGRSFTLQVTDDGVIAEVPGLTLNLRWHNLASGVTDLSAFYVVDKATSIFKIDYPQNMLTPGKVIASIQLLHAGKVTYTKEFEIIVQALRGEMRGVLAKAEFSALDRALAEASEFKGDVRQLEIVKADKIQVEKVERDVTGLNVNKADKKYVEESLSKIVSGAPKGTYNTYSDLKNAHPSGNANIYVVKATKNWYYWSGNDWLIGGPYPGSTTGIEQIKTVNLGGLVRGKNIFNKDTSIAGYHVDRTNGELVYNETSFTSDFILIDQLSDYTWQIKSPYTINIAYYSDIDMFVGGDQIAADNITKTKRAINAKLMRFSVNLNQLEFCQVEKGIVATDYEDFYQYDPNLKKENEGMVTESAQIFDGIITTEKLGDLITGINRFNKNKAIVGFFVNRKNGELEASTDYFTTDFIAVDKHSIYTISPNINNLVINYVMFASDKKTIISSGQIRPGDGQSIDTVDGIYLRFSMPIDYINICQVEKGIVATDYENFYHYNPNIVTPKIQGAFNETSSYRSLMMKKETNNRFVINIPSMTAQDEFIQYEMSHEVKPFTTGETGQNADLWRVTGCNFVRLNIDTPIFLESITNKGAWECAIQAEDYPDFMGTLHGYELMDSIKVYIDGVSVDMSTNFTKSSEEVKVIYKARLIRQGTESDIVAHILRVYTFNQQELHLKQQYKWTGAFDKITNGYVTMLPILRNLDYTDLTSKLITDTAYSDKDFTEYDVSDKTVSEPINQRTDDVFMCHIYGKNSKYAATVSVKYKDESKNNRFYVSNNDYYNKFYFSYWYDTPIAVGDIWDIETSYKIKKSTS